MQSLSTESVEASSELLLWRRRYASESPWVSGDLSLVGQQMGSLLCLSNSLGKTPWCREAEREEQS